MKEEKVYVKRVTQFFFVLEPYEKYKWTGKIVIKTIDERTTIYLERYVTLFGIPLWKTLVSDDYFVFQYEETYSRICDKT